MVTSHPTHHLTRALHPSALPELAERGIEVPRYDRSQLSVGIVHLGVGGFHRAHQAMYLDELMARGLAQDWAICGVGLLPADQRMRDALHAQDGLYTLIVKDPDGSRTARVIGSIIEYHYAPDDPEAVLARLSDPGTRIVSLTITEAGYNVHRVTGEFDAGNPDVIADLEPGAAPRTAFGFVVEALARRRAAGIEPFTVMSCDNVQGNGTVARAAFAEFARLRDPELAEWITANVRFPNSMVDRITPATTEHDIAELAREFGVADAWPVVCEPFTQWVLEENFPASRPPYEQVGVQLVADVEPYELMKLRLLNASHQALGYAGYLSGYRFAHEASQDQLFANFLRRYMNQEALPSLLPVPGIDLAAYIEELLVRFSNPEIRDTLARLCVDTSERIPKFLLPVIRHQLATGGPIDCATAIVASWARYAEGIDEAGRPFEVVDPVRDELSAAARCFEQDPLAFLRNRDIFGDLVDHPRFADRYRQLLQLMHAQGARAAIGSVTG